MLSIKSDRSTARAPMDTSMEVSTKESKEGLMEVPKQESKEGSIEVLMQPKQLV